MTDHIQNLEALIEARKNVTSELNDLQSLLEQKRELYLKYSGIIEYLNSIKKADEARVTDAEVTPNEE